MDDNSNHTPTSKSLYLSAHPMFMLELDSIYKSFYRKRAVSDISLKVKEGEIYGLLGPNGAGKSTLIRIINKIIQQDKGFISFKGQILSSKHLNEIGYLPEERGLYKSMTVEEHAVFLGRLRGLSKTDAKESLRYWLEKFDIEAWKNKRIEELSKGMAQKVQFICTVLHKPHLLILDEPFSGFDPINIELIRKELKQMRADGKSIILSTHNMKSVEEICDRGMILHQGEKKLEGNITSLREEKKEGIFAIQFQGNMIAFANALWTGYEIVDKEVLADNRFIVHLKMRGENEFNDLLATLIPHVKIEKAEEILPSMEDVFIKEVNGPQNTADEA